MKKVSIKQVDSLEITHFITMTEYILVFSVCKNMLVRRKEMMEYLGLHVLDLQIVSIDLQDNKFTMSMKTKDRLENLILNLVRLRGLQIAFVSCSIIQ